MNEAEDNNDYDDRFNSWLSTLEAALKVSPAALKSE